MRERPYSSVIWHTALSIVGLAFCTARPVETRALAFARSPAATRLTGPFSARSSPARRVHPGSVLPQASKPLRFGRVAGFLLGGLHPLSLHAARGSPLHAGVALRMAEVALPFNPNIGSLDGKIPVPLDRTRFADAASVPEGLTPVVLVSCGSFSPPTVMHTRIFETARDFFATYQDVYKIQVIGGYISPVNQAYGKKGLAPSDDRVEMAKRAVASSDWIACDEWEVKQNEWTRTRLSLDRMHIELNKNNGGREIKVMLLCGADILDSMVTPGVWMESDLRLLLAQGVVAIKRQGSDPEKLINDNDLLYGYRNNILLVREWVENSVSSTAVRRAVKRGQSIKYWVADEVKDYILENRLYDPPSGNGV
mmetsp:Transcript_55619/g.132055  ORF Transcript_55619/g.132055 Transcript_55619/m.132055 type:complete len:367 (+) Transcript_55619:124-1224(+)